MPGSGVPAVNTVALGTCRRVKRADLTLRVLTTHTCTEPKGHKGTLGGAGYVYYPDCGDGITVYVCACANSTNRTRSVCAVNLYTNNTSIELRKKSIRTSTFIG